LADYKNLPDIFNQTLKRARGKALDHPNQPDEVRELAQLYQANRLYEEAKACYRAITAMGSILTSHDHYYLADIAFSEGDLDGAKKELAAVLSQEPHYLPARLALAEAFFKTGQQDQAAKEYETILTIDPNQPQALFGLARISLLKGDDDAGVSRLEDLMASHPESTSGAALFAQVLDRRGETDRAVAMTEWSRQKPEPIPPDPWMAELLGDCYDGQRLALLFEDYFKTGQINEAVPFLQRVEELDPKSSVPQLLRGWSAAQGHHDLEAVQQYRSALVKGADPEKLIPYLIQSLFTLGDLPEAAKVAADYYAKMPDSIPILTAYADVAERQRDEKLTKVLLAKLLIKEPYLYAANISLGKILWAEGARDEAAKCLLRIATAYSTDVASRALLGEYYLGKSDPVSAIKPLEQAMAHADRKAAVFKSLSAMLDTAYLQVGNQKMEQGDLLVAVAFYEKATQLVPADPNGFAYKANALVQLKQFKRAEEALEKLASLQPQNPTVYLSLGDVRQQEGDLDRARLDWQRALQLTAAGDAELRTAIGLRLDLHLPAGTSK
jgi:tetratricopeptide (TPR) repeat protein